MKRGTHFAVGKRTSSASKTRAQWKAIGPRGASCRCAASKIRSCRHAYTGSAYIQVDSGSLKLACKRCRRNQDRKRHQGKKSFRQSSARESPAKWGAIVER